MEKKITAESAKKLIDDISSHKANPQLKKELDMINAAEFSIKEILNESGIEAQMEYSKCGRKWTYSDNKEFNFIRLVFPGGQRTKKASSAMEIFEIGQEMKHSIGESGQ